MSFLFRILYKSCLATLGIVACLAVFGVVYLETTLPSVATLKEVHLQLPLRIVSQDGKLMSEFGEERRSLIKLAQVPPLLIHAVLATEDRRFYEHHGVDFLGLVRASMHVLTNATLAQGGSTITMQVARNFFLTRKKTLLRKMSEILLALKIESTLTKDEILELYLNKIYFGKRAYGIAAAAKIYYGKTVEKLTLAQMAMLAGLPQAPHRINPLHSPEAAVQRRAHVLHRMLKAQFITPEQHEQALLEPLDAQYHGPTIEVEAPYLAEMVRQALFARFGETTYGSGYEVTTTIDSQQQKAANHALKRALLEYDQRHGYRSPETHFTFSRNKTVEQDIADWIEQLQEIPSYDPLMPGVITRTLEKTASVLLQDGRYVDIPWAGLSWARSQLSGYRVGAFPKKTRDIFKVGDVVYVEETAQHTWKLSQVPEAGGALVALNPDTGAVTALTGGFDFTLSMLNRASQANRQPGSNFKPFLYAAALEEGFTLASILNDSPFVHNDPTTGTDWRPHNSTHQFNGPTRLRTSLTKSQNMATIRLLQAVGIEKVIPFVERFGFKRDKLPPFLSLALGSGSVTPLELASAYCVFSNGGSRIVPYFIQTIKDGQGNVIYEAPPPTAIPAIRPQIAYLITSVLQDAIQTGTGQRARSLGRHDLAGKTGTTNDWHDGWYSGFNRDVVATAWVGFDEPRSLKEFGSTVALPMWMYFMEAALKDKPEHAPVQPPGLVTLRIDPVTGLLADKAQKNAIYELFLEEHAPTEAAPSSTVDEDSSALKETETLF